MSIDIKQKVIKTKPIIQSTWGTGKTKRTMAMHIKNAIFTQLGWEPGDLLLMTPDYERGTILLEKLEIQSEQQKKEKRDKEGSSSSTSSTTTRRQK